MFQVLSRRALAMLVVCISVLPSQAQDKVWVFFTDKDTSGFDPHAFFDSKAIERRLKHGIYPYHYSDVPVNEAYVNNIQELVDARLAVSRWFNAMCVRATEDQVTTIRNLPFVFEVKYVNEIQQHVTSFPNQNAASAYQLSENYKAYAAAQTKRLDVAAFEKYNFKGQGVRIAIFDIGFKSYKSNPAFEHIRANNKIVRTYNFVNNKEEVDGFNEHGTNVLSCIGGRLDGQDLGLAPEAEFLLARTETWTEFYTEEEHWLEAAEWADKNGADIINSSLGYTIQRYFREDMDGTTSLVSRAANMAASKGILVVNSAGNEGDGPWKNIGAPADADSVLSVGGINPSTGIHTDFSSFGPTWDKRLKPNVSAYGHTIGSGSTGVGEIFGTSFSSPLIAGYAACLIQSRPGFKNMQIFKLIEQSGDLYPYFDYAHGYGVPQASKLFVAYPTLPPPTFVLKEDRKTITITPNEVSTGLLNNDVMEDGYYVKCPDYIFYHVENNKGYLSKYFVINPEQSQDSEAFTEEELQMLGDNDVSTSPLVILKANYPRPFTLRVHYKGYTEELKVN